MEFSEVLVKENPGLCRCCLSEGCYKDLSTNYTWMNDTEVYADMLLECFDISITQQNHGPNGPNRLICEVCITRLRDACNFKKQVLESEKKFVNMVEEMRPKIILFPPNAMKAEIQIEETNPDDDVEYLDEFDFDDEALKNQEVAKESEVLPEPSGSEDITVSTLPVKNKRGRPRKHSVKTEKSSKVKLEDKPRTSKAAAKGKLRGGQKSRSTDDEEPATKSSVKDWRKTMRHNVVQVLLKTTVMPFRWLKSSYRCFYCYDIFQEASDLKEHQHTHNNDAVKEQAMNNYWESVVYVDISNMSCKLCPEPVPDLYEMIDHLVEKHGVVYNKDVGVCMVAFKLDNININCLACGATFYTFGPLLHHTNKDHKGTSAILCELCGQHFKDANFLRFHVKSVHDNTGVLCPECGEKFETKSKLKTHQKNQHDIDKKHKCLVCNQMFQSHYKRSRHMAVEHKTRKEIKCLYCPKTFVFRSMMMTHLRDTHLKVRNHICSVCGWKAFNSNRLKNHMYKHSGEKNFKCDVCDKAFTTKKIMKAHFVRMHKTMPIMNFENPYVGHG